MTSRVEWYWPNAPCKNGHIAQRRVTDNRCVECVRNRTNNYVGSDKEKINRRRYDQSDKGKSHHARYRATEKRRICNRRYNKTSKGKIAQFKSNHSNKYKISRKRFSLTEKGRACSVRNSHARRAKIKQLAYELYSYEDRMKRFAQFGNSCAYCGNASNLTEDHFIPIKHGGFHVLGNIIPACRPCNVRKNAQDPEKWYRKQDFFSEERWNQIQQAVKII